jgi:hypothetical protein
MSNGRKAGWLAFGRLGGWLLKDGRLAVAGWLLKGGRLAVAAKM